MATPPLSDETLLNTLKTFEASGFNVLFTCKELGIKSAALRHRLRIARDKFPEYKDARAVRDMSGVGPSDEELLACVNMLHRMGNASASARALGISNNCFSGRVKAAALRGVVATVGGYDDARKPTSETLPAEGYVKRYLLTCAQNATLVHEPAWSALHAMARHYGARIMIGTTTYQHSQEGSAKRGTGKKTDAEEYDPRLEAFICDDMIALAPGLVWNGHWNIAPTAQRPLEGLQNYNHLSSSIFPHVKVELQSVATIRATDAKIQYTTGAITKRNYIQRKAGQIAEFDHVYGALLVEVEADGTWFCRQIVVDDTGAAHDLDVKISPSGKASACSIYALQYGDLHTCQLEKWMVDATWAAGGMVDQLKPKKQFFHDILDFESASHHNLRDPFVMYTLRQKDRDIVSAEIDGVKSLLTLAARRNCELVVVESNHDNHFDRWLRETSWKSDVKNAKLHAEATLANLHAIDAGESFHALKWAIERNGDAPKITWAEPDKGMTILPEFGGIQMGLHGDRGPGGARGSSKNLARLGQRVCKGHDHTATIIGGVYSAGVKARLDLEYARGAPSAWSQSDTVVHLNSKRQIITWRNGKFRATGLSQYQYIEA